MGLSIDILRVAQALILLFGGIVIYYASKGYRKRKSSSLLLLAIGFAFVTIGAVLAGILFELMNVDLPTVEAIQALAQAAGFFIIVYSLTAAKD